MDKKTIDYSKTVMSQVMMPNNANSEGNVHGGEIIKIMDNAAYVVARKHSRRNVVTARVDELQFHLPVYVGNLITCKAKLVFTGKSSMEVSVKVEVEDLESNETPKTALTAFFTMVALDDRGKPAAVPELLLKNSREKKAYKEGKKRYIRYKEENTS
ncbi:MAG: acyl-CoA thioesterase [Bacillota bacterium]